MALREDIEKQGNWLFRHRSYLPIMGLPIAILAFRYTGGIERTFGETASMFWGLFTLGIAVVGFCVRCAVAGYAPRGTSGRNTKSQVAEMVNVTGMYSITRNPLYLGNFIMVLGVTLFIEVWWLVLVVCFGFWIYHERIILAEEGFLREKFGKPYLDWVDETPVFFPDFKRWKAPATKFSFKTILRREFSTFFGIFTAFSVLSVIKDIFAEGRVEFHLMWLGVFLFGLVSYLVLIFLKKKTHVLDVVGR